MTRQRGPSSHKPLQLDELLEQLDVLGGEASVHQLWLKTQLSPDTIDRVLKERRRERPGVVERALPEGRKSALGLDVGERRWRLVRAAPAQESPPRIPSSDQGEAGDGEARPVESASGTGVPCNSMRRG